MVCGRRQLLPLGPSGVWVACAVVGHAAPGQAGDVAGGVGGDVDAGKRGLAVAVAGRCVAARDVLSGSPRR